MFLIIIIIVPGLSEEKKSKHESTGLWLPEKDSYTLRDLGQQADKRLNIHTTYFNKYNFNTKDFIIFLMGLYLK